ncbi:MAG: NADH-quinone oxidoreductase subunit M [Buchnera aphidicola (Periphyllus lyropictus)]|uniref:complex I subunit 4 family protein n=1 Tax=Buchnera aphidicola TaxID=9 RepID=UPI001ECD183D|nr:NADH-quinone oxidoreductase subunit M [Buchnera aphidicola]NIH16680.1 NADH-quinone oxidoreductase subunit M [Buchnera aphidicola (Periphyllus lyropictus)]USS94587.1 NADH-quinone oxidoreductase subunit M [Buchnera aphidicola (Periphyllus lyropictus)]
MFLCLLIFFPFIGGILSWKSEKLGKNIPRFVSLFFIIIDLFLLFFIFFKQKFFLVNENNKNLFNLEFCHTWISDLGISIHFGIDGFSWLMILLTLFLSFISILLSWYEKINNVGFFYFCIMFLISNTIGIFLSLDLFLFFLFWEIIVFPMYFIMIIWGRKSISFKKNLNFNYEYLIYSQLSGLILLISILGLVINYHNTYHIWTFDYNLLKNNVLDKKLELFLMIGFFISFIIKVPIVPFHSWFPKFHKNTPIFGSLDLIGIVIKTSIYGLLRFCVVLFHHTSLIYSEYFYFLGLFCIFYSIFLAFFQKSIKKIIAYTSISHMGFVLLAIYSGNLLAYNGIIIQMISYSLSTSALIILTNILYKNFGTDNFKKMSGLWKTMNFVPGFFLFFLMSNLGIPGTGNFIGEYLMLLGSFNNYPIIVSFSMIALVFSTLCFLNMYHKIFYGSCFVSSFKYKISKLEIFILFLFSFLLVFIGLFPNFIFKIDHSFIINISKEIYCFILI